ncbi:ANTAR domain-containing protein [Streptomyces rhizosphaerihabitans]|uniref:ANTAR domain-containing protein n=1 Tax=Streptomyces rhizosphaerihabitans TaxID=1266770 RepID=UPI0021C1087F|nr:ANTAR domain-containing protein [Streptomyces rhizosphaerihabitans]MCT9010766.1 ANTAR domain-containing protein [Streptomyces rhizosphaerihabitans]
MKERVEGLVEELQGENAQLHEAMRSHAVVDQAIGVVLAIGQLTPEEGWDVLREVSQRTNIKIRHVSELIIDWARTGKLCTDVRTELERQLAQYTQLPQSKA